MESVARKPDYLGAVLGLVVIALVALAAVWMAQTVGPWLLAVGAVVAWFRAPLVSLALLAGFVAMLAG